MKKNRGRLIGVLGAFIGCIVIIVIGKKASMPGECTILDAEGKVFAIVCEEENELSYECEDAYKSYAMIATEEAASVLMEQKNIDEGKAKQILVKNEIQIMTSFEPELAENMEQIWENYDESERLNFASALTNTSGEMLACFSNSSTESEKNYVVEATYPASTIKPLSVYGFGIEKGNITWSSVEMDSPYREERSEDGTLDVWPHNSEEYTYENCTIQEALQVSNNAIAVKLLKQNGVENSCDFLEESFDFHLEEERKLMEGKGEDYILANIGLGYLIEGVSVKDMVGAYQIFANGGTYQKPYCVLSLKEGEAEIYRKEKEQKRVLSEDTAYVMNRLLKTVVAEDGTGAAAAIEGLDICGKTGTSSNFEDNWFVGMTPEYVCAVWYGKKEEENYKSKNNAAALFREIVNTCPNDTQKEYAVPEGVVMEEYCKETGLLAGENCTDVQEGYYRKDIMPGQCNCKGD